MQVQRFQTGGRNQRDLCEPAPRGGGNTGQPTCLQGGLSWSIPNRTRKVVNYPCAGRSQVKTWWRFEVVLTCKSFT